MTSVFFISIILPDISLAINKSEYLIPILRYINVRLTSLFAWTLFGVLGRTRSARPFIGKLRQNPFIVSK